MLKKSPKKSQKKFTCKKCEYSCRYKKDWTKHLLTTKHQNANYANQKSHAFFHCHHCKRNYKHASSFSRHKKACRLEEEIGGLKKILEEISLKQKQIEDNQKESNKKIEDFSEKVDQKLDNIIIKGDQPTNTINSNNNNNNNISINVFLNEKCNNAINWKDFVDKMRVSLEDLMKTKQIGYAAGMTNIFIKNLEELPTKDRPNLLHRNLVNSLLHLLSTILPPFILILYIKLHTFRITTMYRTLFCR